MKQVGVLASMSNVPCNNEPTTFTLHLVQSLGLCGIAVFFQSVKSATSQHHSQLTNFLADTFYLIWQF